MSASGADQNIADALLVECGLKGCAKPSTPFAKGGVIKGPVTAVTFDPSVETIIPAAEVRERGRQVLADAMGIAAAQPDRESTSVRLARVTAERDELKAENASLVRLCQRMEKAAGFQPDDDPFTDSAERVAALRVNYETLSSLTEGFRRTIAELTAERDEARAARSWMVARDGGRDCILCGHEIRRGEAYEPNPGADELQHVHCRDVEPTTADVVTAYDCLYCRTCYGRYFDGTDAAANHEHPLVPVNVTITLREGHR